VSGHRLLIGLMSGTSLDGVDAVLADFSGHSPRLLSHAHLPFEAPLQARLQSLCMPGENETERAGMAGMELAQHYAHATGQVLRLARVEAGKVLAIGCHGQTIRHRPDLGFTVQIGNPALLAELTGIAVIADFRSRDMAAGGQGAPLVPAFHATMFGDPTEFRAVLNLGGIANVSLLPPGGQVTGFDTGPANGLMDLWASRHTGKPYDEGGAWANEGRLIPELLQAFLSEPYFALPPPKSTGRELFNAAWLDGFSLTGFRPADVQATLRMLTVESIARALDGAGSRVERLIACGGGAFNVSLLDALASRLPECRVEPSSALGIAPDRVEALAFAWLAERCLSGRPGNLPSVTGARGPRILGAVYPA